MSDLIHLSAQEFISVLQGKKANGYSFFYTWYKLDRLRYQQVVVINNVIVEEPIIIDDKQPILFKYPIIILGGEYLQKVQIKSGIFKGAVIINGGIFNNEFIINGGEFLSGVIINGGSFNGEFLSGFSITGGKFQGEFVIDGGEFNKGIIISGGNFNEPFTIQDGTFLENGIPWNKKNQSIRVESGTFHNIFSIRGGEFLSGFSITGGEFQDEFNILGGELQGNECTRPEDSNSFQIEGGTFHNIDISGGFFQEKFTVAAGIVQDFFTIEYGYFEKGFSVTGGDFREQFKIKGGVFQGKCTIDKGEFKDSVIVSGGHFQESLDISGGYFHSLVKIQGACFDKVNTISNGIFQDSFSITSGNFKNDFVVDGGRFENEISISGGNFLKSFIISSGDFTRFIVNNNDDPLEKDNFINHLLFKPASFIQSRVMIEEGSKINHLDFNKGIASNGMVYIESIKVNQLSFRNFINEGIFEVTGLEGIGNRRYLSFLNNEIYLLPKSSKLTIIDSNFDDVVFKSVEFESFYWIEIRNVRLNKVSMVDKYFPINEKKVYTKIEIPNHCLISEIQRSSLILAEIYNRLYLAMKNEGVKKQEMAYYAAYLDFERKVTKGFLNELPFMLHKLSTNYGSTWYKAFFWIIILCIPFYFFYSTSLNGIKCGWEYLSWKNFWFHLNHYFQYLLPTHGLNFIKNTKLTPLATFIDVFWRIASGYLIYQMIAAFRRFGRK